MANTFIFIPGIYTLDLYRRRDLSKTGKSIENVEKFAIQNF